MARSRSDRASTAAAAGWYRDVAEAAAAMTRTGATFEPAPTTQRVYDQLYRDDVYVELYPALRSSLQRLTQLTRGDPHGRSDAGG